MVGAAPNLSSGQAPLAERPLAAASARPLPALHLGRRNTDILGFGLLGSGFRAGLGSRNGLGTDSQSPPGIFKSPKRPNIK